jgi:Cu2+-exporting ATPase
MSAGNTCSHCLLPVGRLGQQREVNGETHSFCCYGCCLAYQVHHGDREEPEAAQLLIRLGIGGFLAMNIMLLSWLLYSGTFDTADGWMIQPVHALLWLLATPLVIVLGGPFVAGAWRAAAQSRVTTDTLVSIGVLAAYGYSGWQVVIGSDHVYFDTATMVLLLFTLGRYLEAQGRARAARSLAPMLAAERAEVRVVVAGQARMQPLRTVRAGDVVRIDPGERIPVDGVVIEGRSACDETILTGQPELQPKSAGAVVHAGSINGSGQLIARATAPGTATRWVRISRCVRAALERKSLLGDTVDRVAAFFVPAVLLLAIASAWFWIARAPFEQAMMTGLAVLVVACPCSLGLAAPLATTLGIGLAAQRGILVRSGGVLEKLPRVRAVAFDKTGTLTAGRPRVLQFWTDRATEREMFHYALALASTSAHPLSQGIAACARDRGLTAVRATEVEARPGAGMSGCVAGERVAIGSAAFMMGLGWETPARLVAEGASGNGTLVYVGWGGRVRGLLALADGLIPEAAEALSALCELGLPVLLLSGDRESVVADTARALGIAEWRSELMPEDKVNALQAWASIHGPVAMVGDGLNDGPVLAAASVGIAVGTATDLARESADIVLPERALESLPWLLHAAQEVRRSIRANLAWAFGYNLVALTIAAAGLLQPILAAALMAGSSLVVVTRSLQANRRYTGPDAGQQAVAATAPA